MLRNLRPVELVAVTIFYCMKDVKFNLYATGLAFVSCAEA